MVATHHIFSAPTTPLLANRNVRFLGTSRCRLGAECEELSKELPGEKGKECPGAGADVGAGAGTDVGAGADAGAEICHSTLSPEQHERLVSELGDVLFDALMLHGACTRAYRLDPEAPWRAAVAKVERRTPYMALWGDGVAKAATIEEAEGHWQTAKRKEKEDAASNRKLPLSSAATPEPPPPALAKRAVPAPTPTSAPAPAPARADGYWQTTWAAALLPAAGGFFLGLCFSRLK